jgi:FG-GAP-like repeat
MPTGSPIWSSACRRRCKVFRVPYYPGEAAIGDFNGDGILDLLAPGAPCVDILLGKGNGTFQAAVALPFTIDAPGPIAEADFNKDGKLDLVLSDYCTNAVIFLVGNGDGTFELPEYFEVGPVRNTAGLATGDFNHRGRPDVAVVGGAAIAVLTNHTP